MVAAAADGAAAADEQSGVCASAAGLSGGEEDISCRYFKTRNTQPLPVTQQPN